MEVRRKPRCAAVARTARECPSSFTALHDVSRPAH